MGILEKEVTGKEVTCSEKMEEDEKKRAFALDDCSGDSSPGSWLMKARRLGSA